MRNRLVASVFAVLTFFALASASASQTADKASSAAGKSNSEKFDPHNLAGVWDTQHPGGFKPGTYTFLGTNSNDDPLGAGAVSGNAAFHWPQGSSGLDGSRISHQAWSPRMFSTGRAANLFTRSSDGDSSGSGTPVHALRT